MPQDPSAAPRRSLCRRTTTATALSLQLLHLAVDDLDPDAGRSRRLRPVQETNPQIHRHHGSGCQQVTREDDELRRAPPPEKAAPTPNNSPAAPPPPRHRRRGHHPILPYVQAGDGDPPPSRCRGSRRRRGIPRLGGADAVDRRGSPKKSPSLSCYSDGEERIRSSVSR